MTRAIRALIVDDEALARRYLKRLLKEHPHVEVVGECGDGAAAIEGIEQNTPDVVFLDVQMPECTGTDVVRHVGPENMPLVVFVTAYDRYAVEAFDMYALDYLLKPFDAQRFARTLNRVEEALAVQDRKELTQKLTKLLASQPARSSVLTHLPVKLRGKVTMLKVDQVDWFEAADYCVNVHSDGREYTIRDSLQALEGQLDSSVFFRTHRSAIVNLNSIAELQPLPGGDYDIKLESGATARLSRRRKADLEKVLGRSF